MMTHADDIRRVADRELSEVDSGQTDREVTVHECSPTWRVFTEVENCDGWIATDTTVDLTR